jgi:hypothetical protein
MRKRRFLFFRALCLCFCAAAYAQESSPEPGDAPAVSDAPEPIAAPRAPLGTAQKPLSTLSLTGKAWSDVFGSLALSENAPEYSYAADNMLRLNIINSKRERLSFEAALEAGLLYGRAAQGQRDLMLASLPALPQGIGLLLQAQADNDFSALSVSLKKFSLSLDADFLTLALGRQIVNSGQAFVFSPADLFSSPDLSGLSAGRSGMDIARLRVPLGERSGIEAVAKPGIDPALGTYSLRASSGIKDLSASIQGARLGADGLFFLSADFKADVILGLYGEAACYLADSGNVDVRACLGADYSFGGSLLLRAEYYYNGLSGARTRLSDDPLALFPEAHNAFVNATWVASEDLQAGLTLLGSLPAASTAAAASANATLSYQAAQNAALTAFLRASYAQAAASLQLGIRMELKF